MRSLRFIKMMSNHEQRKYGKGDTLFREGEDAHEMFIITSGLVQVALQGKDGKVQTVGQRGLGECCGETSCLASKPRNSTVTCISEEGCEVFCVSREEFLALVRGAGTSRRTSSRCRIGTRRRRSGGRTLAARGMRRAAMRMRTMQRERCAR